MSTLTSLEEQVMGKLLAGDDPVLAVLREQMKTLRVSSRTMTGVGFFTEFAVSPSAKRVPGSLTFRLGDLNGSAVDIQHGLGFLLSVDDGTLSALEGYTYDEPWPDEVRGLVLTYSGPTGASRDMEKLKKTIWEE